MHFVYIKDIHLLFHRILKYRNFSLRGSTVYTIHPGVEPLGATVPPRSDAWLAKKNYCAAARGARRGPWIGRRPLLRALAGVVVSRPTNNGSSGCLRRFAATPRCRVGAAGFRCCGLQKTAPRPVCTQSPAPPGAAQRAFCLVYTIH